MYFKFTTNPNRSYLLFPLSSQTQGLQAFYIVLQDWYTMLYTPEGCYTISFVSFHILSSKSLIMREFLISELLWLQWLCFFTRSEVAVQMPKGTDSRSLPCRNPWCSVSHPFICWWDIVSTPAAVRALEHRIRRDEKTHESRGQQDGFHCEATDWTPPKRKECCYPSPHWEIVSDPGKSRSTETMLSSSN